MEIVETLKEAYIQHVLNNGERPKSVYLFAKKNKVAEEEFYRYFGSFDGLEQEIWKSFMTLTITQVKTQGVWPEYSARDKALSLFYSFVELLKSRRSFALFSWEHAPGTLGSKKILAGLKAEFDAFSEAIIDDGLASGELADRKFLSKKYKEALWLQFLFVLNFWMKDASAAFEKTDEAIEKGVNVTFNFFVRTPVDELLEYAKFLVKEAGAKMPF